MVSLASLSQLQSHYDWQSNPLCTSEYLSKIAVGFNILVQAPDPQPLPPQKKKKVWIG